MSAGHPFAKTLRRSVFLLGVAACGLVLAQGRPPLSVGASGTQTIKPQAASGTEWVAVRGQASDLAVSPQGDVYALDAEGRMWKLPAAEVRSGGSGWLTQPGRYKRVRATHDRTMWAIDPDDTLFRLRGSVWYPVLDTVRDVAAAPDGQTLILTTEGKVFDLNTHAPFAPPPPDSGSRAMSMVVDAHGMPWLQREDRSVVRFDGTVWQEVAGARDQLAMVTAGYDGTVLGVAADGRILSYVPMRNTWQAYATDGRAIPPMRQISLSPIGLPWGISRSGELLAERSLSKTPPPAATTPALFTKLLTWRTTGGASNRVSVGQDGTVFTTAPDGTLWQRKRGNEWARIPFTEGQIRAIASGTEGRGWILNDKGGVFQFDRGFQSTLPTPGQVRLIAAGPKGVLWAVLLGDQLSRWNAASRQWEGVLKLPATPLAFSIGMRDEPWFIDGKGGVKTRKTTGEWTNADGIQATSLGVGPEGTVYATSQDEGIYWLDTREMRWKPASGKAVQISVGPGGAPWAITAKNELLASGRFLDEQQVRDATQSTQQRAATSTSTTTSADSGTPPPTSSFIVLPPGATGPTFGQSGLTTPGGFVIVPAPGGGAGSGIVVTAPKPATLKPLVYQTIQGDARFSDIGIGTSGGVFAVSADGGLMCFSNAASRFVLASSGIASRVAVAPDGMPWILDTNGRVSRFDKARGAWRTVPGFTGVDISFGPDGQLWGASTGGGVFRYNVAADSFDLEPIVSSDVAFRARRVAGANARVHWVVTEQNQLVRCEKNICRVELVGATDAAVAPDNTLFALDLLGSVQRYDATKKTFERQNGQGAAIAAGPGGLPWLVTPAGKIDSSGIFAATSKTINAPDCGAIFATAPAPLPPPPSVVLVASADSATLSPGGSLDLLANDTFGGRAANIGDVTVALTTTSSYLALNGASVVVSSNASAGAVLTGSYKVCPRNVFGNCVSATVSITVSGTTTAPTAVSTTAGNGNATVSFTAPVGYAGVTISNYTVTASPGAMAVTGSASPITISGLTNGVTYTFTVTVRYSNGITKVSDASGPVTPTAVTTEPSAPAIGTAVAGNAQAAVSFTAPSSNGGSAITSYTVTSSPGGITATGTASPITVTGLANGTAYTFTVRARNAIGLGAASAASTSVTPSALTAPGIPTIGTATAGNASATVAFTAPANNGGSAITSYTATSSPGGFTGTGAASPVTVTGLTNGTAYTFTVTATNAIGTSLASAGSNSVTPAAAPTVPGAPTGASAVPGPAAAQVSFTAPVSDGGSPITGYTVTSSPGGLTGAGPASPIIVGGLTNGVSYTFTVTATNAVGTGAASAASLAVTPADVPSSPTGVSAAAGVSMTIDVSYTPSASDGGSAIIGYVASCFSGDGGAPGNSGPPSGANPLPVFPLGPPGSTYTCDVVAVNGVGPSAPGVQGGGPVAAPP